MWHVLYIISEPEVIYVYKLKHVPVYLAFVRILVNSCFTYLELKALRAYIANETIYLHYIWTIEIFC